MKPKFFPTQEDFRRWLEENHMSETELIVGFYKVGSGKTSMSWSEAVDQAICFGWIDGVRRKVNEESYSNRFTPRRPNSNWSAVHIEKVRVLTEKDLMKPAGIAAFEKRTENKSRIYVYENELKQFSEEFEKRFRANKTAWNFFEKQANWYKKRMIYWVMTAKQEATRQKRLEKLISESAKEKRI
ncbi:MAG: YdeI/OmpD-associated family protein [Pyrinomonadaceae bacterium]